MANIGKRILSAFVEVTDEGDSPVVKPGEVKRFSTTTNGGENARAAAEAGSEKFRQYFDQLFKDANLPGPDYFEFNKMTEAMQAITDERARYSAAFAGLSVQGLDKDKLLDTAMQYVRLLEEDANNFNNSVDAALKEKVQSKQKEIEASVKRIEVLSKEITDLQNKIMLLQNEVKENEAKIESNSGAYMREMQWMKEKMVADIEKIKQYIS